MYGHRYTHPPYSSHGSCHQPGLAGVFGGLLGLTAATLQGGTRMVRMIVEETAWDSCHDCCAPRCDPDPCFCLRGQQSYHCYHVECRPRSHTRCC